MTEFQENRMRALLTPYIWLFPSNLSQIEKTVLLAIIFLCDKEAMEITYETISAYINTSPSTVKRVIGDLKDKKAIKIIRKMLGNIYIVQWENKELFGRFLDNFWSMGYVRIDQKLSIPFFLKELYNYYYTHMYNNNSNVLFHKGIELNSPRKNSIPKLFRRNKNLIENNDWYDSLIKPNEPLPKKEPPQKIPAPVKSVIEYWKFCGLRVPNETTKSYREDLLAIKRVLNGRMFDGQKYTVEQLKKSITDFSGAALDPEFEPVNAEIKDRFAKYTIKTFIKNYYARNGERSQFLYFLKNSPKRITTLLPDPNPKISLRLKNFYFKHILKQGVTRLSVFDENKFRKATIRLLEFIDSPKVKVRMNGLGLTSTEIADMLCECLVENAGEKTITPGWFCNDITFEKVLPRFFKERGLLAD